MGTRRNAGDGEQGRNRAERRALARRRGARKVARIALGGVAASSGLGLAAVPSADAVGFEVTNTSDNGTGSLRQAILDANDNAGPDVITFAPDVSGVISLLTGQLSITDDLMIDGPGASALAVSGQGETRIFYLYNYDAAINVTIEGLTATYGRDGGDGGAILSSGQNLTLDHVTVSDSYAGDVGGGVAIRNADLTLIDSTISGNDAEADGGGVSLYSGSLSVTRSIITGNEAGADVVVEGWYGYYLQDNFGQGGGLYVYSANSVEVVDSVISENRAEEGGGVFLYDADGDAEAQIGTTTISGNVAEGDGGGIYLYDTDTTITGSIITGNEAGDGGRNECYARALYCGRGGDGGGVYVEGGDLTIADSTISANSATNGGGLDFNGYNLEIVSSTISDNVAYYDGGGLRAVDAYTIAISDTTISGNSATNGDGGGAYLYSVDDGVTIGNTVVSENSAGRDGGGLYLYGADVSITGSTISGNEAGAGVSSHCYYDNAELYCGLNGDGGGIGADDVALTITDSIVDANSATDGGGLGISSSSLAITNTSVADNTAEESGGAIDLDYTHDVTIEDSTISGNVAGESGGGVNAQGRRHYYRYLANPTGFASYTDVAISGSTLADNVAGDNGGGLYARDSASIDIDTSTVSGNTALGGAGVFVRYTDTLDVSSSTFSGNDATYGGGAILATSSGSVTIAHSTVTGNSAGYGPGGVAVDSEAVLGPPMLDHSIVAGNEVTPESVPTVAGPVGPDLGGEFDASFSIVGDVGTATVNDLGGTQVGIDPLLGVLSDNGGPTLTHLPGVGSPAIDAGDDGVDAVLPELDQRGADRVENDRIDIGSVETAGDFRRTAGGTGRPTAVQPVHRLRGDPPHPHPRHAHERRAARFPGDAHARRHRHRDPRVGRRAGRRCVGGGLERHVDQLDGPVLHDGLAVR